MIQGDFSSVRRAPRDREAVFVPEILLVRDLKPADEETKSAVRPAESTFRDALGQFPEIEGQQGVVDRMIPYLQNLRHPEDMDPHVLVIAAYLKVRFPLGFSFTPMPQAEFLSATIMNDPFLNSLVKVIIGISETKSPTAFDDLKVDIVTYYHLLGQ